MFSPLVLLLILFLQRINSMCQKELINQQAQVFLNEQIDISACPLEQWLVNMHDIDPSIDKVFIDIGYNKGYNYAHWAELWGTFTGIRASNWAKVMQTLYNGMSIESTCGTCNDCEISYFQTQKMRIYNVKNTSFYTTKMKPKRLIMTGLDIDPKNVINLEEALRNFTTIHKFKRLIFYNILGGASDAPGEFYAQLCEGGFENCRLISNTEYLTLKQNKEEEKMYEKVTLYTIDSFIQHLHEMNIIPKQRDRRPVFTHGSNTPTGYVDELVDILYIDTEGNDAKVLQGATQLLVSKQVRFLMFEYHGECPWPLYSLHEVIQELDVYGYNCYFAGQAKLWRLTGCWDDLYEFHRWANIVCIKRGDVWSEAVTPYIVSDQYIKKNFHHIDKNSFEAEKKRDCTGLIESNTDIISLSPRSTSVSISSGKNSLVFNSVILTTIWNWLGWRR